jgi:Protein of unknown function (DUF1360)
MCRPGLSGWKIGKRSRVNERPLASYAGLVAVFGTALGAFVALANGRVDELRPSDLALVAAASHKLARLIAKDDVTTFVRAPVTQDEDATEPKPRGLERALGELVTCPSCLGLWAAAGLAVGVILRPREVRFGMSILATYTGADFLNAAFVRLKP